MARPNPTKPVPPFKLSTPVTWTEKQRQALADDVNLSLRDPGEKPLAEEMLASLASVLGSYVSWLEHDKEHPRFTDRRAALDQAISELWTAFNTLSELSSSVMCDLKNFGEISSGEVKRLHSNALNGLSDMMSCMTQAQARYPRERGRKSLYRDRLIDVIGVVFDKYYKVPEVPEEDAPEYDYESEKEQSRMSFIKQALAHPKIRPTKRPTVPPQK